MTNEYGNELLHKVLLSAMKDIDKICRENGLRYYLHAGTLLGAFNHKGFIPWDDDVDISMPVDDYEKLVAIIEKEYADRYFVETFDNTESHFSKLNKVRINGAQVVYNNGIRESVFIDLSVFHHAPNEKVARKIQAGQLRFWDIVLSVKRGDIIPSSIISKLVFLPFSHLSKQFIGRSVDSIMTRYDNKKTDYYALMIHHLPNPYTGTNGYLNDCVPVEICEDPKLIDFEDTQFMVYSDPERDLIHRYGPEYYKPYPIEKRVSKHGIVNYELTQELKNRLGL